MPVKVGLVASLPIAQVAISTGVSCGVRRVGRESAWSCFRTLILQNLSTVAVLHIP